MNNTLYAIVLAALVTSSWQQQCTKKERDLFNDDVSRAATIGDDTRRFPENNRELSRWCSDSFKYLDRIEKYKRKCLMNLQKQMVGVGMYAIRKSIKSFCKNNSRKADDFVDGGKCFNRNLVIVNKCIAKFLQHTVGAKSDSDKKKIPHFCCAFHKAINCFDENLITRKGCTQKRIDVITNYLDSLALNMLDMLCGSFTRDSDKCDRLGMPPKVPKNQQMPKSFIIPMLDLMESLPEV